MRGGKARKRSGKRGRDNDKSEATSTTGVLALSSLTSKVDSMADSVATLAQLVLGKRQTGDVGNNASSDDDNLFTDNDDDSATSERSQSSKRRKTSGRFSNRNHPALVGSHPTPGRQGTTV